MSDTTNDMSIDDAELDTDVTGTERVPASDGGASKAIAVSAIKDYVLGQIAAITAAGEAALNADKLYTLKGSAMKPVPALVWAQAILDYAFSLAGVVSINGNEIIPVKDSGTKKTVTIEALKEWLEANLDIDADIDISALGSADPLADDQAFAVDQSGSAKKATITALKAHILAGLYGYAVQTTTAAADDAYVFIYANNELKKVTVANSGFGRGDVKAPSTTTANTVPRWDTTAKTLKDGLQIVDTIADSPTGTKLASEAAVAAVKSALNSAISTLSQAVSQAVVATKVTEINATTTTDDTTVPSAKAVKSYVEDAVATVMDDWLSTALAQGGDLYNAINSSVTTAVASAVGPAVSSAIASALGEEGAITSAISEAVSTHGALSVGTTSGTTHPGEEEA